MRNANLKVVNIQREKRNSKPEDCDRDYSGYSTLTGWYGTFFNIQKGILAEVMIMSHDYEISYFFHYVLVSIKYSNQTISQYTNLE